jgi:ATP-dependent DNA helicase DinG
LDDHEHIKEAVSFLEKDGPLSRCLKGYEPREQQKKMLLNILEAYQKNDIALIEAGTGTGKSMAYLIPAVLWALKFKERTVISTHTINLQEQLVEKDIPLLLKALKIELKAVLVKGMGNYVCLRKLDDMKHQLRLMPLKEADEFEKIEAWIQSPRDGSRSSLPLVPSPSVWESINAEHDTCSRRDCPYYKDCFYFKAKKQAEDAQILVVNHHLLCSDLIKRDDSEKENNSSILPDYFRVILDEAHHFEDIATDFFANHASLMGIYRDLHRLSADAPGSQIGRLFVLKQCLLNTYKKEHPAEVISIIKRLTHDLPALRWDVWHSSQGAFEAFANFAFLLQKTSRQTQEDLMPGDAKLRLLEMHQTHPDWQNIIQPKTKHLIEAIDKLVQALASLDKDFKGLKNEKLNEMANSIIFDVNALSTRFINFSVILRNYLEPVPQNKVRWIEVQSKQRGQNVCIIDADLDVSKALSNYLFNKFKTIILCSATLTTNQHFNFIRKRLGLTPELLEEVSVTENVYDSPFNYQQQALLAIPTDIPDPTHPSFVSAASEHIWKAIQASRGNAFVLFTSYAMLKTCYENLAHRLTEAKFHPLKQGDSNRQALLNKFKKVERSVLFGTDSFWEGVDVTGEALRCVILVKLPFKVPSEPIIQARSEVIAAQGGDPFFEYALPHAIVKFKQGFGRLIRHRRDRGCIVCLDNRILTKGYGKAFLKSLPNCQQMFAESAILYKHMEEFYRKTYHLVK